MRVYVPASPDDLRRLHEDGRLPAAADRVAFAVTAWAVAELGATGPEDEEAEFAVLSAAAEESVAGSRCAAVLVLDVPGADLPTDGFRVSLPHEVPRRRLAAIHLPPGLEWYAAQELPDVVGSLT